MVRDLLDKRKHDKLALTIFRFAYVPVPLTYDKNSLKELLERIDVGLQENREQPYMRLYF